MKKQDVPHLHKNVICGTPFCVFGMVIPFFSFSLKKGSCPSLRGIRFFILFL